MDPEQIIHNIALLIIHETVIPKFIHEHREWDVDDIFELACAYESLVRALREFDFS